MARTWGSGLRAAGWMIGRDGGYWRRWNNNEKTRKKKRGRRRAKRRRKRRFSMLHDGLEC